MTINQNVLSQSKTKYKEVQMTQKSEVIDVSADRLWEIVGPGFADVGLWSTSIDHTEGSGEPEFEGATCSNRACDLNAKGFSKIKEKLTLYDPQKQELAYQVTEGMPGFVLLTQNHWRVIDLGNGQSQIEMTITMRTKKLMGSIMGGMLRKNIETLLPTVMNDLKIYAETGEVSESKKARMAKLEKKRVNA